MLCKDGSVLCALDYRGLDVDSIGEFRVKAAHDAMQNAASSPDKRVYQANLTHRTTNDSRPMACTASPRLTTSTPPLQPTPESGAEDILLAMFHEAAGSFLV